MNSLKLFATLVLICFLFTSHAQANQGDYYYEIPEYSDAYTPGTVAGRVVDGLGFRYYWASEGLTTENLEYRPSAEARNLSETIDHIYGLTKFILNAIGQAPEKKKDLDTMTYEEKRANTLVYIKRISETLKNSEVSDLDGYMVKLGNGEIFPFWNLLNGPIADAIYHVGQIVTLRRSSGNPINQNISVLRGRIRN